MSYLDFDFPHTGFFESDLRELIKQVFIMNDLVTNFVSINAIKYADPIQWNITKSYEKNTVVIDGNSGVAYISVRPVPAGVALTREQYWTKVFDLSVFITKGAANFARSYEEQPTTTATMSTDEGEWVVWDTTLYKALTNIHPGDRYVPDGNIRRMTVEDFYDALKSIIDNEVHEREAGDDALELALNEETEIRGEADSALHQEIVQESVDRENADTGLQDNIDAEAEARENADNDINAKIGNLSNLNTSNKSNIVNAINSLVAAFSDKDYVCPEDFGAVGDGITDDTSAVQQAFYANKPIKFLHDYAVTSVTYSNSSNFIDFNGHWLRGIGQNNDFVLVIYEAMYNVFNNIRILISEDARSHYYGCIRIHSSASRQSQYNVFNGVELRECWHGIVWGAKEGNTSVSNAQSETFINNFRNRSVPIPFLGNQDNGYLTFIGGVFDINQYEQWADTRFNFDDNRCVVNHVGKVNFIGCEFAATVNYKHVGFVGSDIHAYDSILEICGTQAFITGDFSLVNWYNGYIGQVSRTPFIVDNGTKGTVILENGTFHHGGIVAGNNLFYGYEAPETIVYLNNVTFADTPYSLDMFGNLNVKCNNFRLPADNITINDTDDITGLSLINNNSTGVFAFGTEHNCHASFDSILGMRGVAVQFTGGIEGGYYTPMIPIYGGTLYHANSCGFTDGNDAYIDLEYFDANGDYIGADTLQVLNGIRLNRSSIRYAPANAKSCRLRIANGSSALQLYTITCNIAIYWKQRVQNV